jgi:hypothetical protein
MMTLAFRAAACLAALTMAGCVQERPLAPRTAGMVLDARTGEPVPNADIRFHELAGREPPGADMPAATSGSDGAFLLPGVMRARREMVWPVSGVYADQAVIAASRDGYEEGFAHAYFISGLGEAETEAMVLLYPDPPAPPEWLAACGLDPVARHAAALMMDADRLAGTDWLQVPAGAETGPAQTRQFIEDALTWRVLRDCGLGGEHRAEIGERTRPLNEAAASGGR